MALLIICVVFGFLSFAATFVHHLNIFPFGILEYVTLIGLTFPAIIMSISLILARSLKQEYLPGSQGPPSQSFFYAIIAAVLYALAAVSFLLHFVGKARKLYPREPNGATTATVFHQTTGLMVHLLLGAVVYANIEGWTYLNALYWADFTVLTIGIGGDFTPKTALGRALLLPYALGGIIFTALLVNSIRMLVERGRTRLRSHLREKLRVRTIRSVNDAQQAGTLDTCCYTWQASEEAFELARKVSKKAETQAKLISFWLSFIAGVGFFLAGAGIFTKTEQEQQWSYGISLYFAYITILTIGYGDYQPQSEAGRPFFVVWTLLAVPVLTVLISNSVDTAHGSFGRLVSRCVDRTQRLWRRAVSGAEKPLDKAKLSENTRCEAAITSEYTSSTEKVHPRIESGESSDRGTAKKGLGVEKGLMTQRYMLTQQLLWIIPQITAKSQERFSFEEWSSYLPFLTRNQGYGLNGKQPAREQSWQDDSPDLISANAHRQLSIGIDWLSRDSPIFAENEAQWMSQKLAGMLEDLNILYEKGWLFARTILKGFYL
jgi:potassium channel subfamily K, other eukaryote